MRRNVWRCTEVEHSERRKSWQAAIWARDRLLLSSERLLTSQRQRRRRATRWMRQYRSSSLPSQVSSSGRPLEYVGGTWEGRSAQASCEMRQALWPLEGAPSLINRVSHRRQEWGPCHTTSSMVVNFCQVTAGDHHIRAVVEHSSGWCEVKLTSGGWLS